MKSPITSEKHPITGAWIISAIVGGYRVQRTYYGYTKKEAIAAFKSENRSTP